LEVISPAGVRDMIWKKHLLILGIELRASPQPDTFVLANSWWLSRDFCVSVKYQKEKKEGWRKEDKESGRRERGRKERIDQKKYLKKQK
jgi:hypothetical protein